MAEKLTEFPADAASRSGYSRYNWEQYFDGSAWELAGPQITRSKDAEGKEMVTVTPVGGEDFTVGTKSFRSAAAQAAKQAEGKVKTAVVKRTRNGVEVENVVLQFVKMTKAPTVPAQVTPATAQENKTDKKATSAK